MWCNECAALGLLFGPVRPADICVAQSSWVFCVLCNNVVGAMACAYIYSVYLCGIRSVKLVGLLQNYWTSTGCGRQVAFWPHLSGGQVKIIPYFYHIRAKKLL